LAARKARRKDLRSKFAFRPITSDDRNSQSVRCNLSAQVCVLRMEARRPVLLEVAHLGQL
jgi:hypothetical protein